mmetsp:Transcript_70859/g.199985  ORF Transcript_70859/g.199985 Transcript_70859/m.199985 type:complete len:140 (+) Transcript_70859:36-455(+)
MGGMLAPGCLRLVPLLLAIEGAWCLTNAQIPTLEYPGSNGLAQEGAQPATAAGNYFQPAYPFAQVPRPQAPPGGGWSATPADAAPMMGGPPSTGPRAASVHDQGQRSAASYGFPPDAVHLDAPRGLMDPDLRRDRRRWR